MRWPLTCHFLGKALQNIVFCSVLIFFFKSSSLEPVVFYGVLSLSPNSSWKLCDLVSCHLSFAGFPKSCARRIPILFDLMRKNAFAKVNITLDPISNFILRIKALPYTITFIILFPILIILSPLDLHPFDRKIILLYLFLQFFLTFSMFLITYSTQFWT